MRHHILKSLTVAVTISLAAVAASAQAGSLRQGATGSNAEVTGSLPGQVLWTNYQTDAIFTLNYAGQNREGVLQITVPNGRRIEFKTPSVIQESFNGCLISGDPLETSVACPGDNIIRLINPNGAANGNLAGAKPETVCAMVYVFDDDQEMGECCGCPLTSAQLATFSVAQNLTSNWGLGGGDNAVGSIAIVAAEPNSSGTCNPTNVPGYSVTTASNLLGSVTHIETPVVALNGSATLISISNGNTQNFVPTGLEVEFQIFQEITETPLSDDAEGDPTNLIYLQNQCGAIVGNGTGGGICTCPTEG
jgi:hypothetical protein